MEKHGKLKVRRYKGMDMVSERYTDYPRPTWPLTITEPHARVNRVRWTIREILGWITGILFASGLILFYDLLRKGWAWLTSWADKSLDQLTAWAGVFLGL